MLKSGRPLDILNPQKGTSHEVQQTKLRYAREFRLTFSVELRRLADNRRPTKNFKTDLRVKRYCSA